MKIRAKIFRYFLLGILLITVWLTQAIPPMGEAYARSVYPIISFYLSALSQPIPFAIGDLFIFLSIVGVILYPFYAHFCQKLSWKKALLHDGEYLLWVYAWFYLAWGLNYSQKNFYQRTEVCYAPFQKESFQVFIDDYITLLNRSYTPLNSINRTLVREETVRLYTQLSDSLGVHRPPHPFPQAKTMLFTPLISKVGVTGSMGPFFCEFTLNGGLLPVNYPATYAHEYAHLLGITSEAEANFYAYQVCTRSHAMGIRFSGYFSILGHVLRNAKNSLSEEAYNALFKRIRPGIIEQARENQAYWAAKYSPFIGSIQDGIYDLYLKGNKIESGRQNYSEVVGLLIAYQDWKKSNRQDISKKE